MCLTPFAILTKVSSASDQILLPLLPIPCLSVESTKASVKIDSDVNGFVKSKVAYVIPVPKAFIKESSVASPFDNSLTTALNGLSKIS